MNIPRALNSSIFLAVAPTILPASTSQWKEVPDASSILMVKPTDWVIATNKQHVPKVRLLKHFFFGKIRGHRIVM